MNEVRRIGEECRIGLKAANERHKLRSASTLTVIRLRSRENDAGFEEHLRGEEQTTTVFDEALD